jgi:hypothetical protein
MRTPILTVTLFAFISQNWVAFAQQGTQGTQVEATPIERCWMLILSRMAKHTESIF